MRMTRNAAFNGVMPATCCTKTCYYLSLQLHNHPNWSLCFPLLLTPVPKLFSPCYEYAKEHHLCHNFAIVDLTTAFAAMREQTREDSLAYYS